MSAEHHFVVVTFTAEPERQARAANEIGDYVASFLSQQPGFVSSRLLVGNDGTTLVHQAEWTSEAAFAAAGKLARAHPDLPKLMAYNPQGAGYRLARTF